MKRYKTILFVVLFLVVLGVCAAQKERLCNYNNICEPCNEADCSSNETKESCIHDCYDYMQMAIMFEFNGQSFSRVNVIEKSNYYLNIFEQGLNTTSDGIVELLKDGNAIYEQGLNLPYTLTPYSNKVNGFRINLNGQAIERKISFCNNNGICEPCNDAQCTTAENAITCRKDCQFNSNDNLCDMRPDGICDPDCVLPYGCKESSFGCDRECAYENTKVPTEAEASEGSMPEKIGRYDYMTDYSGMKCVDELGGSICNDDYTCVDGFISAADTDFCCLSTCVPIEYRPAEEDIKIKQTEVVEAPAGNTQMIASVIIAVILIILIILYFERTRSRGEQGEEGLAYEAHYYLSQGYNKVQARQILLQRGWREKDVDRILVRFK